jgi:hypothetical protein
MDNTQTIMDAEQFYSSIIAPTNVDKSFIVPSWAIAFAEKYADYKAAVFYNLKLRIELENSEETIKKTLKIIDNIIEQNG